MYYPEVYSSNQAMPPGQHDFRTMEDFRDFRRLLLERGKAVPSGSGNETPLNGSEVDPEITIEDDFLEEIDDCHTVQDLSFHIDCLVELAPAIEQNIRRLKKNSQIEPLVHDALSISNPAEAYILSIREKFKGAKDDLVYRLGEANWQRHVAVRKSMDAISEEIPVPGISLDAAHSLFERSSAFHDSGIGTTVASQATYAQSHTSFASSKSEGEGEGRRVPPMPAEVRAGKPFRCHICGDILSWIKHRNDWK